MKNLTLIKQILFFITFTFISTLHGQTFPCTGKFLIGCQSPYNPASDTLYFSELSFTGPTTITPTYAYAFPRAIKTTAPVRAFNAIGYNVIDGYIWGTKSNSDSLIRFKSNNTFDLFRVTTAGVDFGNAGDVNPSGIYVNINNGAKKFTIVDLNQPGPTYTAVVTNCDLKSTDIAFHPTTGELYGWYSQGGYSTRQGLYTINQSTGDTNQISSYIHWDGGGLGFGAMFFTPGGDLYGYNNGIDSLYKINITTGGITPAGKGPIIDGGSSDGAACPYRVSLDQNVSVASVCTNTTFKYGYVINNSSKANRTNAILRDTLPPEFKFTQSIGAINTALTTLFGGTASATLSNYNGGTNNLITATGLRIVTGLTTFSLNAMAVNVTSAGTFYHQAWIDNLPVGLNTRDQGDYVNTPALEDRTPITVNCSNTLPIELVSFDALLNENTVNLSWITATEINNDYFTIERSYDGINWKALKKVKSIGNSSKLAYYHELDTSPLNGINYYRLMQTDIDNTSTYSDIRDIDFRGVKLGIEISPNPNNGVFNIYGLSTKSNLKLFDNLGNMVKELIDVDQFTEVDLSSYDSGVYFLQITNNNALQNLKVIKQ